jgi:hypothetical protein
MGWNSPGVSHDMCRYIMYHNFVYLSSLFTTILYSVYTFPRSVETLFSITILFHTCKTRRVEIKYKRLRWLEYAHRRCLAGLKLTGPVPPEKVLLSGWCTSQMVDQSGWCTLEHRIAERLSIGEIQGGRWPELQDWSVPASGKGVACDTGLDLCDAGYCETYGISIVLRYCVLR